VAIAKSLRKPRPRHHRRGRVAEPPTSWGPSAFTRSCSPTKRIQERVWLAVTGVFAARPCRRSSLRAIRRVEASTNPLRGSFVAPSSWGRINCPRPVMPRQHLVRRGTGSVPGNRPCFRRWRIGRGWRDEHGRLPVLLADPSCSAQSLARLDGWTDSQWDGDITACTGCLIFVHWLYDTRAYAIALQSEILATASILDLGFADAFPASMRRTPSKVSSHAYAHG